MTLPPSRLSTVKPTPPNRRIVRQLRLLALVGATMVLVTTGFVGGKFFLLFGVGCSALLLGLTWWIGNRIGDQVRTIELARADAEAGRQSTQDAAAELAATHRELKLSEERFRAMSDSAPIGIFKTDAAGSCTYTNACWQRMTGRPWEESLGSGWYRMVHPEDLARVDAKLRQAAADACLYDCEYRIHRADGEIRWVHALALAERSLDGKICGSVGTLEDITERKRAEAALQQMHEELLETSRQAGMAEVATAVLHNVGNVLNSVNITADCLSERLRKSKAASLSRVVTILRQHEPDLGPFFHQDPQGQKMIGFLSQLADHQIKEQAVTLTDVIQLQKNVEHIKEIITRQQSFGRICGIAEPLQISEIVEDTLRLNSASFPGHEVQVDCDFGEVPPVTAEKHKVLQILVNLVRNAKHACDATDRNDKLVRLRVSHAGERVKISVSDNGVGITPENLARIFKYGFTTKKNGHGFGLHSAALAAQEMGGALHVESEGAGTGATFTLELPLSPPPPAEKASPVAAEPPETLASEMTAGV